MTPLLEAVSLDYTEIIQLLVEHGANLHYQDEVSIKCSVLYMCIRITHQLPATYLFFANNYSKCIF